MSENTFNFELVSPEKRLISEQAWQVTIPGEEGNFGVRAQHSPLVSSIRPGVVEIVSKQGDAPVKIFIAGGFADVTATNCTVLAEEATKVEDLDVATVNQEVESLESKLSAVNDDIEKSRYTKQLIIAKAKQEAVSGE